MATVYLAIQENFERQVALKVMSPELAKEQDFSERFLREARIVSQLVHPHIVTVHDVGIQNGHHYLSMQYIDGKDLKQLLPDMSARQIFRVLKEVARALDYAGGKGYVHRDVKPENIMLNSEDGRAILMDFGIARASRPDNSMTRTGMALGTPHYMSPEQARGQEVDGRSDLYNLGVLFYYMLVGNVPFDADSPVAVGIKHLTEPVPTLPVPLACYQPVLSKLLAKKPEQRYQRGREFCRALEALPTEPLQRWHEREGFEFHSVGQDTPVRSTASVELDIDSRATDSAMAYAGAAARPVVDRTSPPTPVPKWQERSSGTDPGESLHIPREDLAARAHLSQRRSIWPGLLLLLVIAVGAAYYFFPVVVQEQVDRGLALIARLQGQPVANEQGVTTGGQEPPGLNAAVRKQAKESGSARLERLRPEAQLQGLWRQINTLLEDVQTRPERRGNLIALYREVLEVDPANTKARAGLEAQQSEALAQVRALIADEKLDEAESLLATSLTWFPDLERQPRYEQLQQALAQDVEIRALLAQAAQYVDANKLSKPAGTNATETYRQVLALDSDNEEALEGLRNVARRYRQLAAAQQRKQDSQKALGFVNSGLAVDPDNASLKTLRAKLQTQLQTRQTIRDLLTKAESLAQQEKLFSPEGAARCYLDVLAIDDNHQAARQGLRQLLQQRYSAIAGSIAGRRFEQATAQVEEALQVVPRDERLLELLLEIESNKPAIDSLLLSGSGIESMNQPRKNTVVADRLLYIAFRYKNLAKPTTVFQAMLFDGSRSLRIAAVPVVVAGSEGVARFRIERPVEGFTEGGYHIDITLADKRIYTQAFTIAR